MRFHFFFLKLLSLENSVHAILSFEKFVTQMSPTISQKLFQSYSKIFYHPTSHLLRDRLISSFMLFFALVPLWFEA